MPNTSPAATISQQPMPALLRAAQLEPASYNAARQTVDVVFATGALVRRYDWMRERAYDEQLVITPAAVNMARMQAGASVLNTHGAYDLSQIIGVVESAEIVGTEARATLRLSTRPEIAGIVQDVQAGVIRHISVGATVQAMEMIAPEQRTDGGTGWLYRATAWTPHEISFVPVPADPDSSTRSQPQQPPQGQPCTITTRAAAQQPRETMTENTTTPGGTPTTAAPETTTRAAPTHQPADTTADLLQRTAEIATLCAKHGMPNLAPELIRAGADVGAARAKILDELARADHAAGGHRNTAPRIETAQDQMTMRLAGIEQAVLHRLTPGAKLDDNGKQYRGMGLLEMGREFLEAAGVSTRGMDKMKLAGHMLTHRSGGMHGTSDFTALFANVATKRLRTAYEENPGTYEMWARRAPNAPDFKQMTVVQLSGAPDLMQVNEAGEYTYGTVTDGGTSYGVVSYGRIVALSRQAIINDDLRAFDRLITAFGFAARRLENRLVYAQLTGASYSTENGNLQSGTGSALQASSLATARTSMRKQKGLGGELLNLAPAYLIVPASLEQTAYQLTSANFTPATATAVNEFRTGGRTAVEPIAEALLDESSATAWYVAASSAAVDTVEYCYLDGAEGPRIEQKEGWEVAGTEFRCTLDFAAKAVDYRGLHKAAGA